MSENKRWEYQVIERRTNKMVKKNWCSEEFNILYFSVKSVIMTNECGFSQTFTRMSDSSLAIDVFL